MSFLNSYERFWSSIYKTWSSEGFIPEGKNTPFIWHGETWFVANPREVEDYLDSLKKEEIEVSGFRDGMTTTYETKDYFFIYTGKDYKHLYPFVLVDKKFNEKK